MPAIEWNECFFVGVPEIDAQHEKLTALINELYHAYMNGRDADVLSGCIDGLCEYCAYHFSTEEALMRKHGWPRADEHTAMHREFVAKTLDYLVDHKSGKAELTPALLDWLVDWWMGHIQGTDREMAAHLCAAGAS